MFIIFSIIHSLVSAFDLIIYRVLNKCGVCIRVFGQIVFLFTIWVCYNTHVVESLMYFLFSSKLTIEADEGKEHQYQNATNHNHTNFSPSIFLYC